MGAVALPDGSVILLDSACIIYIVERVSPYAEALEPISDAIRNDRMSAAITTLSITETLTKPLRDGDVLLASRFHDVFRSTRNVALFAVDSAIAEQAAELRARYGLRTPDAVQIATAIEAGCTHVIANDLSWKRVTEIPIIVLDEVLAS